MLLGAYEWLVVEMGKAQMIQRSVLSPLATILRALLR